MTKTTKEERDEIRLLEARATLGPWLPSESTRVPKVLDRDGGLVCEFDTVNGKNDREAVAAMRNIVPDLLADLDAAEAERDRSVSERSEAIVQMQREWTALTDEFDGLRAQRDRAESELATLRADRDAALIHLPVCCGSLADAADTLRQERDELAAERDALKAKLAAAESAHSELFLSGQVAELRARLAELVKWAKSTVFQGLTEDQPAKLIPSESLRGNLINLRAAIAAARGGES